jgi:hypothetical protein
MHKLHSIGYLNPGALDLLQEQVGQGAIILDIRRVAGSRYRPQFSAKRLRERFGEAYLRAPELGNSNYNQPGAPIVLLNPTQSIPLLLDLLEQTDICLLCKCQQFATCHSALVVAEILRACPSIVFARFGEEITHGLR